MSILNVWLFRDRALVGVDTDAVSSEGQHYEVSKMLPIPHINAVLACRGSLALLGCVFVQLMISDTGDFDVLADRLPAATQQAFDGPLRDLPPELHSAGDVIVLVGWSPRLRRMRTLEVSREPGAAVFTLEETEQHYIAPWDPSIEGAPDPANLQSMMALAEAQVGLIRRTYPNGAAGGRLIMAVIYEKGMQIYKGREFGPREQEKS